jgi:type IV pilus assembly protein PilB
MAELAKKTGSAPLTTAPLRKSKLKATIKDQSGAGKIRIGELLCKEGYITSSQLREAVAYQKKHRGRLGSVLLKLGYIEEETIANVLSRLQNYPSILLSKISPDPEALRIVPYEVAKKYMAFPLRLRGDTLEITMTEPSDTSTVEELQNEVRKSLMLCVSAERDIVEPYRRYYNISEEEYYSFFGAKGGEEDEDQALIQVDDFGSLVSEAIGDMELETPQEDDTLGEYSAPDAPIIKLVNGILIRAVKDGVSDIHIEPFDKS